MGAGRWRGEWVPAPWYVGVRIGEAGHPGPERERHKGRKRKLTPEQSLKKQLALKKERAKAKLRRYQDKMKKPRNIRKVKGAKVDIRATDESRPLLAALQAGDWAGDSFGRDTALRLAERGLLRVLFHNAGAKGVGGGAETALALQSARELGVGSVNYQETGILQSAAAGAKITVGMNMGTGTGGAIRVDQAAATLTGEKPSWGLLSGMMQYWSRFEKRAVKDKRGFARYLGRVYRASKEKPGVLLLNIYHTKAGAQWDRIMEHIEATEWNEEPRPRDPNELMRRDLAEVMQQARDEGLDVVAGGDMNEHKELGGWAKDTWWGDVHRDLDLRDVHAELHGTTGTQHTRFLTEKQRETQTARRLDYVVANAGLIRRGGVEGIGTLVNVRLNTSDHKAIVVELNMRVILGLGREEAVGWERPELVRLKAGDKRLVGQYRKNCEVHDGAAAEGTEELCKLWQKHRQGEVSSEELHARASVKLAEAYKWMVEAVKLTKAKAPGYRKEHVDGWSPELKRNSKIKEVCDSVRHTEGGTGAAAIKRAQLIRKFGLKESDVCGMDGEDWRSDLEAAGKEAQKHIHGRARHKLRMRMKYNVQRQEYRRRNGELGKFVKSVMGEERKYEPMLSFKDKNGKIKHEPGQVKKLAVQHYAEWMGKGRKRWYMHEGSTHPLFAPGGGGDLAREELLRGEYDEKHPDTIPGQFKDFFGQLRHKEGTREEDYADLMEGGEIKEVPKWYFDQHFMKGANNKAAGKSKVQLEMIGKTTETIRELVRVASNISMTLGKFDKLHKSCYLHPVPKDEPGDYRPLRLVEVVTKMQRKWLIYGIYKAWQKSDALNPNNFGFKPGCTLDQALRIKNNMIEDARFHKKELCIFNDDLKRCFDSIERPWMRLALRRLRVPPKLVSYLVDWMDNNQVEVITGYGPSGDIGPDGVFSDECGVPQGDTASPLIFIAVYSMLQDWMDREGHDAAYAFGALREGSHSCYTHLGFADDMTYTAGAELQAWVGARRPGTAADNMQRLVQKTDEALGALGVERKTKKCNWASIWWDAEGTERHDPPRRLMTTEYAPSGKWAVRGTVAEIEFVGPEVTIRDLGLHRSTSMLPGEHVKTIMEKLTSRVASIAKRRLTPVALRYISDCVVQSALLYGEKFAINDEKEIEKVEAPLRRAFLKAARMARSTPKAVVCGPDELGGLWEAWEDKLRRTQLEMFANELHDPKMRPYAMGAVRRLIETTGVTDGIFEPGTDLRLELAEGSWLGDLVAWAVQKHMRLELPKVGTTAPWEWDLNVKEHLEREWKPARQGMSEEATDRNRKIKSGIMQQLQRMGVTWLSDMREDSVG